MAELLSDVTARLEFSRRLKNIESQLNVLGSVRARPSDALFKALAVFVKYHSIEEQKRGPILETLKASYGEDEKIRTVMARMVTKAAVIPADTTTSGWADNLVQTVIGDFIESLMPLSVYGPLAALGGSFTFGRNGAVILPARNTTASVAGSFIAQGAPIPVRQGGFAPISFTPKKLGVITTLTSEINQHSTPAIELILRQAILEDTSVAIDLVLLDANAATTTRPAGLKNGVAKTTVTAGAGLVALVGDLKALAGALITGAKGNLRAPVWIMNPSDLLAASLTRDTTAGSDQIPFLNGIDSGKLLGYPVITSTSCPVDTMFLMDAADFVTAAGDAPDFNISDQATLHMEDTTPLALGTAGAPPTVAAPTRSLFQTDSLAVRMLWDLNWSMHRTGTVAWTDTMTWN